MQGGSWIVGMRGCWGWRELGGGGGGGKEEEEGDGIGMSDECCAFSWVLGLWTEGKGREVR